MADVPRNRHTGFLNHNNNKKGEGIKNRSINGLIFAFRSPFLLFPALSTTHDVVS